MRKQLEKGERKVSSNKNISQNNHNEDGENTKHMTNLSSAAVGGHNSVDDLLTGPGKKGSSLRAPGGFSVVSSDGTTAKLNVKWNTPLEPTPLKTKEKAGRKRSNVKRTDLWKFDADMFAKLFRPTQTQCGRMFELTIDKLLFLAFPVQIPSDQDRTHEVGISASGSAIGMGGGGGCGHGNGSSAVAQATGAPNADTSKSKLTGEASAPAQPGNGSSTGLSSSKYSSSSDSAPSQTPFAGADGLSGEGGASTEGQTKKGLTMFSLIFVLDVECECYLESSRLKLRGECKSSSYGSPYPGSKESIDMYRKVAKELAAGMLFEERKSRYISDQVEIMLSAAKRQVEQLQKHASSSPGALGDGMDSERTKESVGTATPGSESTGGRNIPSNKVSQEEIACRAVKAMFECSELARELCQIYNGLFDYGEIDIYLHRRVRLSFALRNPSLYPTRPLRPYQAILLYDGNLDNLHANHMGSSTQLGQLIQFVNKHGPTKSFEEISSSLTLPIQEVFRMAAHLVFWQKGHIVDAVQPYNVYRVSPRADLNPFSLLHFEFQTLFGRTLPMEQTAQVEPVFSLTQMLEVFSMKHLKKNRPKTIEEHAFFTRTKYGLANEEFHSIFVWMLKHGLLNELHRYYYLLIPSRSRAGRKKVRAGDTQTVGLSATSRTDFFAAALHAADLQVAEEAQAAEAQAEQVAQTIQSSQAMHAENSTYISPPAAAAGGGTNAQRSGPLLSAPVTSTKAAAQASQGASTIPLELTQEERVLQARRQLYINEPDEIDEAKLRNEIAFLDAIASDSETYRLFHRLVPYFHGRHHSREITWRENISLEVLEQVVQAYNDVVFPFYLEN